MSYVISNIISLDFPISKGVDENGNEKTECDECDIFIETLTTNLRAAILAVTGALTSAIIGSGKYPNASISLCSQVSTKGHSRHCFVSLANAIVRHLLSQVSLNVFAPISI